MAAGIKWLFLRFRRKLIHILCRRLYQDKKCDIGRSIIIAGVGRSGTTWLSNIIVSQLRCRIMWEPFNPHAVDAFSRFDDFQYRRPDDPAPDLYAYASSVLKGNIRNKWIDREVQRIFVDYRLIKEIRANLFLNWLARRFPDVPVLFIVRHPCAVVLSRLEANWGAEEDLNALLSQAGLVNDYLLDKMDVINKAGSIEAKHALLWAIQHLVPIKQFQAGKLNTVFYENLCLQPEEEIPKIFSMITHSYRGSVFKHIEMPSRTILRTSAILTGENKVMRWKSKLSQSQICEILSVIRDFDLDYIYEDSAIPIVDSILVANRSN